MNNHKTDFFTAIMKEKVNCTIAQSGTILSRLQISVSVDVSVVIRNVKIVRYRNFSRSGRAGKEPAEYQSAGLELAAEWLTHQNWDSTSSCHADNCRRRLVPADFLFSFLCSPCFCASGEFVRDASQLRSASVEFVSSSSFPFRYQDYYRKTSASHSYC